MALKPPDGTFIIDSDLRPSLPTSDSVLVCAHSVPEGKSFGVWVLASSSPLVSVCASHKEREFVKERKVWHPLECESYFLFVSFPLLRTYTHALIHTNARRHLSSTLLFWSSSFSFFFLHLTQNRSCRMVCFADGGKTVMISKPPGWHLQRQSIFTL